MGPQVAGQSVQRVPVVLEQLRAPEGPLAPGQPWTTSASVGGCSLGLPWECLKKLGSAAWQPGTLGSRRDCEKVLECTGARQDAWAGRDLEGQGRGAGGPGLSPPGEHL